MNYVLHAYQGIFITFVLDHNQIQKYNFSSFKTINNYKTNDFKEVRFELTTPGGIKFTI